MPKRRSTRNTPERKVSPLKKQKQEKKQSTSTNNSKSKIATNVVPMARAHSGPSTSEVIEFIEGSTSSTSSSTSSSENGNMLERQLGHNGFYDNYDFDRVGHQIGIQSSLDQINRRNLDPTTSALQRHPSQLSSGGGWSGNWDAPGLPGRLTTQEFNDTALNMSSLDGINNALSLDSLVSQQQQQRRGVSFQEPSPRNMNRGAGNIHQNNMRLQSFNPNDDPESFESQAKKIDEPISGSFPSDSPNSKFTSYFFSKQQKEILLFFNMQCYCNVISLNVLFDVFFFFFFSSIF